jgi:hypothetical protein
MGIHLGIDWDEGQKMLAAEFVHVTRKLKFEPLKPGPRHRSAVQAEQGIEAVDRCALGLVGHQQEGPDPGLREQLPQDQSLERDVLQILPPTAAFAQGHGLNREFEFSGLGSKRWTCVCWRVASSVKEADGMLNTLGGFALDLPRQWPKRRRKEVDTRCIPALSANQPSASSSD